ncbi:MAG: H-NS histone family protein [Burkholderiales bacterium]|nr:H-NS histone family protein [Burkholderiales bacterium]
MDISKLSFPELHALLQETQQAINQKRAEEVKVLADGYAKKLQMSGFTIAEGIEALKPYLPARSARSVARAPKAAAGEPAAATAPRAPKYANPQRPQETWVGVGKPPQWFRDLVAQGASKESLLIKR